MNIDNVTKEIICPLIRQGHVSRQGHVWNLLVRKAWYNTEWGDKRPEMTSQLILDKFLTLKPASISVKMK